jgi:ribokinase
VTIALEGILKPICIIGSINMDLFTIVDKMPVLGETVFGSHYFFSPGGKGANQAVATARLGESTILIGKVGQDHYGEQLIKILQDNGVDTRFIQQEADALTGFANIYVDNNGNNQITVVPGANSLLTPEDIDQAISAISSSRVVVCQLEIPAKTAIYGLKKAKEAGAETILNPTPTSGFDDAILNHTDILIPNQIELRQIMQTHNEPTEQQIFSFMAQYGLKILITTLGENGCISYSNSKVIHYPAKKVAVVNTTAAGDAFIGGFAKAYNNGQNLSTAIDIAQEVAAYSVMKNGSMTSLPYMKDLTITRR